MLSYIILIPLVVMFTVFYLIYMRTHYKRIMLTPQNIGIGFVVVLVASLYPLLIYQGVRVFSFSYTNSNAKIKDIEKERINLDHKSWDIRSKINNLKEDIDILFKNKASNIDKINNIKKEKDKLIETENKLLQKINDFYKQIIDLKASENIIMLISLLIGGVIALAIGVLLRGFGHFAMAAVGSGSISIVWGYSQSWYALSNRMIFVSILIALIVLIALLLWYGKKSKS